MTNLLMTKFLIPALCIVSVFYYVFVLCIVPFFLADDSKKSEGNISESKELPQHTQYKLAKAIISTVVVIGVLLGIVVLIFRFKIAILLFALYVFGALQLIITSFYYLYSAIKYVIWQPSQQQKDMSKNQEQSIAFLGLVLILIGLSFGDRTELMYQVKNWPGYMSDLIVGTGLVVWYFVAFFFFFSLLLINMHYICLLVKTRSKPKTIRKKASKSIVKRDMFVYSSKAWDRMLIQWRRPLKLLNAMWWAILLIFDTIVAFIFVLWEWIEVIGLLLFAFLPRSVSKILHSLCTLLSDGINHIILSMSRVVAIFSFIIVYIIIKYNNVMSSQGIDVFEFLSSVIVIPLVISQLIELHNKK